MKRKTENKQDKIWLKLSMNITKKLQIYIMKRYLAFSLNFRYPKYQENYPPKDGRDTATFLDLKMARSNLHINMNSRSHIYLLSLNFRIFFGKIPEQFLVAFSILFK